MFDSASSPAPDALVNAQLEQFLLSALLAKPSLIERLGEFNPEALAVDGHADIFRALAANPAAGAVGVVKSIAQSNSDLGSYIIETAGMPVSTHPDNAIASRRALTSFPGCSSPNARSPHTAVCELLDCWRCRACRPAARLATYAATLSTPPDYVG